MYRTYAHKSSSFITSKIMCCCVYVCGVGIDSLQDLKFQATCPKWQPFCILDYEPKFQPEIFLDILPIYVDVLFTSTIVH